MRQHFIISGRVQMVMFRDFVTRKARRLGISGWVRNLPDGTVEAVAEGSADALERLRSHLERGSLLARVDSVVATNSETAEELPRIFRIRFD